MILVLPVIAGLFIGGRRSAIVVAVIGFVFAAGLSAWAAVDGGDDGGSVVALFMGVASLFVFGAAFGLLVRGVGRLFLPQRAPLDVAA